MRILIRGCNNHKCEHWSEDKCEYPLYGQNDHGAFDNLHEFDYDHITGKLSCVTCLHGDE